jgi:hypothetical protein
VLAQIRLKLLISLMLFLDTLKAPN